VIGVHRSPWSSPKEFDTYLPFHHNVISEKALTYKDLKDAFEKEVKEFWELCFFTEHAMNKLSEEEFKNCDPDSGYINAEYFLASGNPFDIENIDVHGFETGEHLGL
tara:strand:+ start:427 stop:747 length:321 start_codon:yes stop_codon:yes gene_type:complete